VSLAEATRRAQEISDEEFELVREIARSRFGISMGDSKRLLVVGRLQGLVRRHGFDSLRAYCQQVLATPTPQDLSEFIDQISTNHTYFYREPGHFEYLTEVVLPELTRELRKHSKPDIRIWCAAASTGEEPYTLAMLLREHLGVEYPKWQAGVLATDISSRALEVARTGVYEFGAVQKLPARLRQVYLSKQPDGRVRVVDRIRHDLVLRRFNLINERFPFKRPFHVTFCRNVMIYFDAPTRARLVNRIYDHTEPGGYLFIGHSEAIDREATDFEWVHSAVYRRPR